MFSDFYRLLVDVGTAVTAEPGAAAAVEQSGEQAATDVAAAGGLNPIFMILIWVAVIGVFYFFSIRPQSKRDKQMKEMQSSLRTGDNVVTTAGFFGKIAEVGDDCFIVEFGTNRGVRVPVRKSDIVGIKEPKLTPSHNDKADGKDGK
ncbi:MAG: preprotein translocase subunit YajC [Clostridiales bacterium]|jgi:preprotein translocase subunit YajC|nr:preprotein translocase subunit YajC [Clostridiales bacterium]